MSSLVTTASPYLFPSPSIVFLDELPILDKLNAIKQLGDAELFETMLEGFEEMSMRKSLLNLKIAMDDLDYFNIRLTAHSLKGSASYVRAERVKSAAEKVYNDIDSQNVEKLFRDYPALIKQCIMLKKAIRYETCKKKKIQFKDDNEDFNVPISKFYMIAKRSSLDFEVVQMLRPDHIPPIPLYEFNNSKRKMSRTPRDECSQQSDNYSKDNQKSIKSEKTNSQIKADPQYNKNKEKQKSEDDTDLEKIPIKVEENENRFFSCTKLEGASNNNGCSCILL